MPTGCVVLACATSVSVQLGRGCKWHNISYTQCTVLYTGDGVTKVKGPSHTTRYYNEQVLFTRLCLFVCVLVLVSSGNVTRGLHHAALAGELLVFAFQIRSAERL